MNRPTNPLAPFLALLVAALAITQGLQLLRGLLASLSVYLGQVQDVDPALLALLIFAIFAAGLAVPLAWRLLGRHRALPSLAASLAILRLAEQLAMEPDARLAIQITGAIVWLWLTLSLFQQPAWSSSAERHSRPIIAVLLGLTIDTAIKGAFWTLDPGFSDGLSPLLLTVAIAVVHLTLIASLARSRTWPTELANPPLASVVIGPGLALHLLIFQNLSAHAALLGWGISAVFAWTLAANLVAILLATTWLRRGSPPPRWVSLVAVTCLLTASASLSSPELAAFGAIVGPATIAALWCSALMGSQGHAIGWLTAALGLLAIPMVLFGWYAHYEIAMPVPHWILPIAAAVVVAIPSYRRKPQTPADVESSRPSRPLGKLTLVGVPAFTALLLFLPLHQFITQNSPPQPPDQANSLRVLTYNIHQGFDLTGRPSLEKIADLIEHEQPQIVALQEVPRGWVINGSVDALSWLARRLDMHSAWGPAADPFWGNAVLSRYPIKSIENRPMPNNEALRFDRAYLLVTIEVQGRLVQVVATHLHHIERQPQHRLPQVRALLEDVDWTQPTILFGDLNAQPHHEELRLLTRSGLSTNSQTVPTYPADRPQRQIDHILTTDHFVIEQFNAIQTTASDHLPLIAVLTLRDRRR